MVGVVARLTTAEVQPDASLTTVGDLELGGSSYIIGHDSIPKGWGGACGPLGVSRPGILIDHDSGINYTGKKWVIEGGPPVQEDPSMSTESLMGFGDLEWDRLVDFATVHFSSPETITRLVRDSVEVDGTYICDTNSKYNWGNPDDPGGACGNHFPIIYAHGNLEIAGKESGQGVLLVNGDLDVTGGHEFYGPVIIRGTLRTTGSGGHFIGGVIAANVHFEASTVLGNARVQFSRCAVARAVFNNPGLTQVRPLERRSWVDLSSMISG